MKIFLDTAHLEFIEQWLKKGLLDGVTTNPTLLQKEGGNPKDLIQSICALVAPRPVSVEVTEVEPYHVYEQAYALHGLAPNLVVKIPCHVRYYEVMGRLVAEQVAVNSTLVFTLSQGLAMCKLGVNYISPFIGRLDDIGVSGIIVLNELVALTNTYNYKSNILAASIRTVSQLHDVIMSGVQCATVPAAILEQAFKHPLTDHGMDKFLADWQLLGINNFP